jgi:hypothetical protein
VNTKCYRATFGATDCEVHLTYRSDTGDQMAWVGSNYHWVRSLAALELADLDFASGDVGETLKLARARLERQFGRMQAAFRDVSHEPPRRILTR